MKANPVLIEFFLTEVGFQMPQVMVNQYGNYFFQRLLSNCSVNQRLRILSHIKDHFIEICCDKQGTHTIQTIFDNVTTDLEEDFIGEALRDHVYDLSVDQQGTHVIRKVLKTRSSYDNLLAPIFEEIHANLFLLCLNQNGLCVIKIVIELTTTEW